MRRLQIRMVTCLALAFGLAALISRANPQGSVEWTQSAPYIAAAGVAPFAGPSPYCQGPCALVHPGFWVREDDGLIHLAIHDDVLPAVALTYEFFDQGGNSLGGAAACAIPEGIRVPADAYWLSVRPAGIAGVCSPVGTTGTITLTYERPVEAPTLTSISPSAIPLGSRDVVVSIVGDNMNPMSVISVSGSGVSIVKQDVRRDSGSYSTMRALVSTDAEAQVGTRDVVVSNGAGLTSMCVGCLTVDPAPHLNSVTPARGSVGRATTVTIRGTNFDALAVVSVGAALGADGVAPSDVTANAVTVVDSTTITASFNIQPFAAPGPRSVEVRNSDGGTASCDGCFTITSV